MYGMGYILSKRHGFRVYTPLNDIWCEENLDVTDEYFDDNVVVNSYNYMDVYDSDRIRYNVILDDYFQTGEIVKRFGSELKSCFELNEDTIDGTIVHYRLGDLLRLYDGEAIAKLSYFEKSIESIGDTKKIYITSDSPDHENVRYLIDRYDMTLVNMSCGDTIRFASRFTHKVLSLGTFSWWIGLLGKFDSEVYCPEPSEYCNWLGNIYVLDGWKYMSYK